MTENIKIHYRTLKCLQEKMGPENIRFLAFFLGDAMQYDMIYFFNGKYGGFTFVI